jgi:hypothetical protein
MEEQYRALIALQEDLPEVYSDDNLLLLEQMVTRYQEILNHIAQTADPHNNTLYYRERIHALEKELKEARYGHEEKQRIKGFRDAVEMTVEGISALLFHLSGQHLHNAADKTSR